MHFSGCDAMNHKFSSCFGRMVFLRIMTDRGFLIIHPVFLGRLGGLCFAQLIFITDIPFLNNLLPQHSRSFFRAKRLIHCLIKVSAEHKLRWLRANHRRKSFTHPSNPIKRRFSLFEGAGPSEQLRQCWFISRKCDVPK